MILAQSSVGRTRIFWFSRNTVKLNLYFSLRFSLSEILLIALSGFSELSTEQPGSRRFILQPIISSNLRTKDWRHFAHLFLVSSLPFNCHTFQADNFFSRKVKHKILRKFLCLCLNIYTLISGTTNLQLQTPRKAKYIKMFINIYLRSFDVAIYCCLSQQYQSENHLNINASAIFIFYGG